MDSGIAGGFDTVSDPPIVYSREYQQLLLRAFRGRSAWARIKPFFGLRPRHFKPVMPGVLEPRTGLSMGEHCEQMAKTWKISRADQDALANLSHVNAGKAWARGFCDLVISNTRASRSITTCAPTGAPGLAQLDPHIRSPLLSQGTLTAGNSTPLTVASAVLLASEDWAAQTRNLPVLAYFSYNSSGRSVTTSVAMRAC
jgi:acetyl-CoA C-acetyltransferase